MVSDEPAAEGEGPPANRDLRDGAWVASTYFAEGFPYTIANNLVEVLFKAFGASYAAIGLTSILHLPWNLKFLWGPFLDRYGTKRRWLLALEVLLTVALAAVALSAKVGSLTALSVVFVVVAVLSATHDIAVDGYYLEALDEAGQSRFVGFRAMAFRVATIAVGGLGLVVVDAVGWTIALVGMAAVMGLVTAFHMVALPHREIAQRPFRELGAAVLRPRVLLLASAAALAVALLRGSPLLARLGDAWSTVPGLGSLHAGSLIALATFTALAVGVALRRRIVARLAGSDYGAAFATFLEQPRVGLILAFVALFRVGESFLVKMKWPFFDDVLRVPLATYGWANGTVGLIASIGATLLGGWLIARHGLRRWIWPFVLMQNLLNLLYVALALGWLGGTTWTVATVICVERFGEGLGTAVLMVYLMRCCQPGHRAAHMAIVTALMSVGYTLAGMVSGFVAQAIGFAGYFGLSFVATLPGMALLLVIPHLDRAPTPTE